MISHWALSLPLGALLRGWRIDQPAATRSIDVRVLMLAQALAAELVRVGPPPSLVELQRRISNCRCRWSRRGAAPADIQALLKLLTA